MAKGWKLEPGRHALAAKGVKTGRKLTHIRSDVGSATLLNTKDLPYYQMEKNLEKNESDNELLFNRGRELLEEYESAPKEKDYLDEGSWDVIVAEFSLDIKEIAVKNKIPIPKGFNWKEMAEYYFDVISDVDER